MLDFQSSEIREWRGNRQWVISAYRKYCFPVVTYKVGKNGERRVVKVEQSA